MANLQSLLKRRYAPLVNPLAPENTLARDIKFNTSHKTGEDYREPVRLGLDQGLTRSNSHTSVTLAPAVEAVREVASLKGSEIIGAAEFSYGDMSQLSESKGDSDKAYDQTVGVKIMDLSDGASQHLEMDLMYGCGAAGLANIGVISAIAVAASAGVVTINISRGSFIPAFWNEAANAQIDVYSPGGVLRNAVGKMTVTGVNASQARVQLTGAVADAAAIVANDVLHFAGARNNSMVGFQAISENTSTLFGISATQYPQWRVVNYPVGGALNFDKVMEGVTASGDNGNQEGLTLYLNPRTWTDLMTDEAALRRHLGDGGGGTNDKVKTGYKTLEFHGPCGIIQIKQYRYMKQGHALACPTSQCNRIGSSDITFSLPGSKGNEFFYQEMDNKTGARIRVYSDQALLCHKPFQMVWFTGLTNTGDYIPS